MKQLVLGLIGGLALVAGASARAEAQPVDTLAGAESLWLSCTVSDQGMSKNCRFDRAIKDDAERLKAGTELGYLDAHPFPIIDSAPGSDVVVLVRLFVRKSASGAGFQVTAPDGAAPSSLGSAIEDPAWAVSPHEDWSAFFIPERAERLNKTGQAVVRCVTSTTGALVDCSVNEDPAGYGFGAAAAALLAHARMRLVTASGAPTAGRPYSEVIAFTRDGIRQTCVVGMDNRACASQN